MIIDMYSPMKVVGRIEDSFEEKKQQVIFYQLIVLQGKGAETITCTQDVYEKVLEGYSYVFLIRVDTRANNKLKIHGVGTELVSNGTDIRLVLDDVSQVPFNPGTSGASAQAAEPAEPVPETSAAAKKTKQRN